MRTKRAEDVRELKVLRRFALNVSIGKRKHNHAISSVELPVLGQWLEAMLQEHGVRYSEII
jgi:hypothetical protein